MTPKRENIVIRIELIPGENGQISWGWVYAMDGAGGSGPGGFDQLTCWMKAYQAVRKEVRKAMETREEKTQRMARRKEALRKSKEKGLI